MTEHLTGTAGSLLAQRNACEASIRKLAQQIPADPNSISRLRDEFGTELADIVLGVARIQVKAHRKFGGTKPCEPVWWATEKSLQQATPWQVARLKSSWFGSRCVYDLCCGCGGDTLQLARRGSVVAVDRDEIMAAMTTANIAASGLETQRVRVHCGDAAMTEIPEGCAVHIDPDRRPAGGRTSRPDQYQPPWSQVLEIVRATDSAIVKLAPAAKLELADFAGVHRCWISLRGAVREQSLLWGETQQRSGRIAGSRSAVSLTADSCTNWFAPTPDEVSSANAQTATHPASLLIDPDASIRAAGLTETFASMNQLQLLGTAAGFLTGENFDTSDNMAVCGRVIWTGACDDRKLRREFRSRNAYPAVIKVRGSDHDPAMLVKRYRKCGERPVTLWIGRTDQRVFAAMTH